MKNIQAILFNRNEWTLEETKNYLKHHNIIPIKKVHKTKQFYRYRLINPDSNKYKYYTKKLNNGIDLIIYSI